LLDAGDQSLAELLSSTQEALNEAILSPTLADLAGQEWSSFYKYPREPAVSYGLQAWELGLKRLAGLRGGEAAPPSVWRGVVGAFVVNSVRGMSSVYYGVRPSRVRAVHHSADLEHLILLLEPLPGMLNPPPGSLHRGWGDEVADQRRGLLGALLLVAGPVPRLLRFLQNQMEPTSTVAAGSFLDGEQRGSRHLPPLPGSVTPGGPYEEAEDTGGWSRRELRVLDDFDVVGRDMVEGDSEAVVRFGFESRLVRHAIPACPSLRLRCVSIAVPFLVCVADPTFLTQADLSLGLEGREAMLAWVDHPAQAAMLVARRPELRWGDYPPHTEEEMLEATTLGEALGAYCAANGVGVAALGLPPRDAESS